MKFCCVCEKTKEGQFFLRCNLSELGFEIDDENLKKRKKSTLSVCKSCKVAREQELKKIECIEIPCRTSSLSTSGNTTNVQQSSTQCCREQMPSATVGNSETSSLDNSPKFFDMIRHVSFEFKEMEHVEALDLFSTPKNWDVHRNFNKFNNFTMSNCQTTFRIYDTYGNIFDKVNLYNFLTSKSCSVNKDVHEWLQEKLYEEVRNRAQIELIKYQVHRTQGTEYTVSRHGAAERISLQRANVKISKKSKKVKKIIDVDKFFDLCCAGCGGKEITTRSTRRGIKKLSELTSSNRNKVGDRLFKGIEELLGVCGQSTEEFLDYLFDIDPSTWLNKLMVEASSSNERYIEVLDIFSKSQSGLKVENFDGASAVHFTDRYLISDAIFDQFFHFNNLKDVIISVEELANERGVINHEVISRYNIRTSSDKKHIHLSCEKVFSDSLLLLELMDKPIPEEVEVKLFWDGRPGNEVICGFVLLNTDLSTQCRNNFFLTDMYSGVENKLSVQTYFDETFDFFDKLQTDGFKYTNKSGKEVHLKCKVIVCTDLSALWKLFDDQFVCPYCDCSSGDRFSDDVEHNCKCLKSEDYPNLFKNVIIDSLHAKLRILECLIGLIAGKLSAKKLKDIEASFAENPKFSQFKFRPVDKTVLTDGGKRFHHLELQMPYINGDQADVILLNYEKIFFKALESGEFSDWDCKIWSSIRYIIFGFLEAPEQILNWSKEKKDDLNERLKWTQDLLRDNYPNNSFAYYLHIILYHLDELIDRYGCLSRYMNQGCEGYHALGRLIRQRKSNHKNKYNLPAFAESVLLPTRLLYMCTVKGKKWHGLLKEKKEIRKEWKDTINILRNDANFARECETDDCYCDSETDCVCNTLFSFLKRKSSSTTLVNKNIWMNKLEMKKLESITTERNETQETLIEPAPQSNENRLGELKNPKPKRRKSLRKQIALLSNQESTEFQPRLPACLRCKQRKKGCDNNTHCQRCKTANQDCIRPGLLTKKKPKKKSKKINIDEVIPDTINKESNTSSGAEVSSSRSSETTCLEDRNKKPENMSKGRRRKNKQPKPQSSTQESSIEIQPSSTQDSSIETLFEIFDFMEEESLQIGIDSNTGVIMTDEVELSQFDYMEEEDDLFGFLK